MTALVICLVFGVIAILSFTTSAEDLIDQLPFSSNSLSDRIQKLIAVQDLDGPDYTQEFFTPVSVAFAEDPRFTLCRLNFKQYSAAPHSTPMFKDFLSISNCGGGNSQHATLSSLQQQVTEAKGTPAGRIVYPTAFIFHESRVGSTLVANLLGSDPYNMVFSESAIPAELMLRCRGCSHERHVELFRSTILMIGRSPIHKRLFFKFQSITSTQMKIALEAFPDVPWAFLFRSPVQTMMSHLDPRKGGGRNAPCLRSKRSPAEKVKEAMRRAGATSSAPDAAWCAAHLNMLCEHAYEAFEEFGHYTHDSVVAHEKAQSEGYLKLNSPEMTSLIDAGAQRGFLVDYATLPGLLPRFLLHAFGVQPSVSWVNRMEDESQQYSKGARRNSKAGVFTGDSEDKEKRATEEIEKWGQAILLPTTAKMLTSFQESVVKVKTELRLSLPMTAAGEVSWDALKVIPTEIQTTTAASARASGGAGAEGGIVSRQNKAISSDNPFASDHSSTSFEEPHCPPTPPSGYPKTYPMKSILDNWNTDDTIIPPIHFNSLCRFDYQSPSGQEKAMAYRKAEVPFLVFNHPEVDAVVGKWKDLDYLSKRAGVMATYKTETSPDNHFMYWKHTRREEEFKGQDGKPWVPPTGDVKMTFGEWIEKAVRTHNETIEDRDHYYFRISSSDPTSWIFQELPFFQPKKSLFMVEPDEQRGIHCRFGMRSVIAECHFDGSRNAIASFGGLRRWILAHPNQCENLYLFPRGHPSGRHSEIDWSLPTYDSHPKFATAEANEIIMRPGEVLYLPTNWFHYIISLNVNFQCNTRSGRSSEFDKYIRQCGF